MQRRGHHVVSVLLLRQGRIIVRLSRKRARVEIRRAVVNDLLLAEDIVPRSLTARNDVARRGRVDVLAARWLRCRASDHRRLAHSRVLRLDDGLLADHRLVVVQHDVAAVDESVWPARHDHCFRRLRRALLANYRRHRRRDLLHSDARRLVQQNLMIRREGLVQRSAVEPSRENILEPVLVSILSNNLFMVTKRVQSSTERKF